MIDDESRGCDDMRDSASRSERRATIWLFNFDEARVVALEQADRARNNIFADNEKNEYADRAAELQSMYNNIANAINEKGGRAITTPTKKRLRNLKNEAKGGEEKATSCYGGSRSIDGRTKQRPGCNSTAIKRAQPLSKQCADLQSD